MDKRMRLERCVQKKLHDCRAGKKGKLGENVGCCFEPWTELHKRTASLFESISSPREGIKPMPLCDLESMQVPLIDHLLDVHREDLGVECEMTTGRPFDKLEL